MPTARELSIRMEDRPGVLGKICTVLADHGVNILAFYAFPMPDKKSLVRLVVDNPTAAKKAFDSEGLPCTEAEVAQARLANRPGALAQAATKLGQANININYSYCGIEGSKGTPVLIFGVEDVGKAAKILEQAAAATA
jgi:hypothetical protein